LGPSVLIRETWYKRVAEAVARDEFLDEERSQPERDEFDGIQPVGMTAGSEGGIHCVHGTAQAGTAFMEQRKRDFSRFS
jgi:hypothetical protein